MNQYKGMTTEGKEVCGWYCEAFLRSYIAPFAANVQTSGKDIHIGFFYEVSPKSVSPFICKDKNNKDVWAGDEVIAKRSGFEPMRLIAIAGYKSWVWLYQLNDPTYHWETVYQGDIELIEEKPK